MWMAIALAATNVTAGPAEVATRAAIARAETVDPRIHAIAAIDPGAIDAARTLDRSRRARGPLFGEPVLIKDNIETAGPLPTTAGSRALIANVTGRDAPLVGRLRGAGAVILGKAALSEWANFRGDRSLSGWSGTQGQVRNPYALARTPCGSSSGSGAAVAAGIVAAAIGTETDGSITCPASMMGIVGLKPTVGLVSRSRIIPISVSQDTAGPMTRDVATAARLLTAIAGSDGSDPATAEADKQRSDYAAALVPGALNGVRIGVMRFAQGSAPATRAAFEKALALLRTAGAVVTDVADPSERRGIGAGEHVILVTEFRAGLNGYLADAAPAVRTRTLADVIAFNRADAPRTLALFGQELFEEAQRTNGLDDPSYLKAKGAAQGAARAALAKMLKAVDMLVAPTAQPAWFIDTANGDAGSDDVGAGQIAAVAGTPHLTVPMALVGGLPVGLSFMGPAWSEARLLAAGAAFEAARGAFPAPTFAADVRTEQLASSKP